MSQKLYQIRQYIKFIFQSKTRWGHGVHSPFVYDLIESIFNHPGQYYDFKTIEDFRFKLLRNQNKIKVEDFGAGALQKKQHQRSISKIAKTSLLDTHHAQLLFRLANRFQPRTMIELGSSLGITASYLASACKNAQLYTFEGSPEIAKIAQHHLKEIGSKNSQVVIGSFDEQLPLIIQHLETVDFAFIDGNHRYEPTLKYFEWILEKINHSTVLIFDDIYWSKEMTQAWKTIIAHPKVTISIDLFRMGLVFFRTENPKQDFKVKFF